MKKIFFIFLIILTLNIVFADLEPRYYEINHRGLYNTLYIIKDNYYTSNTLPENIKLKDGDKMGQIFFDITLSFWNVGEKGNKDDDPTDYSEAEISFTIKGKNWQKFEKIKNNKELLSVKKINFKPKTIKYKLKFSGYANGHFESKNKKISGDVYCEGTNCFAQFTGTFLNDFYPNISNKFTPNLEKPILSIPIPLAAFLESCPKKCSDDPHHVILRAVIDEIEGEVEVIKCGKDPDDWQPAREGMILLSDDCVRTDEDSKVRLVFGDMSDIILGEETELAIGHGYQKDLLQLFAGRIWENTKHALKGGEGLATIDMPEAVAGIKGTSFIAEVTPYSNSIVVFDGIVELKSKRTNKTEDITKGKKATVKFDGNYTIKEINLQKEKENWEKQWQSNFLGYSIFIIVIIVLLTILIIKKEKIKIALKK